MFTSLPSSSRRRSLWLSIARLHWVAPGPWRSRSGCRGWQPNINKSPLLSTFAEWIHASDRGSVGRAHGSRPFAARSRGRCLGQDQGERKRADSIGREEHAARGLKPHKAVECPAPRRAGPAHWPWLLGMDTRPWRPFWCRTARMWRPRALFARTGNFTCTRLTRCPRRCTDSDVHSRRHARFTGGRF